MSRPGIYGLALSKFGEYTNSNFQVNSGKITQDFLQNPAMPVVLDFNRSINTDSYEKSQFTAIAFMSNYLDFATRLQIIPQRGNVKGFASIQSQRFPGGTVPEFQRQNTHADKIATMDSLEAAGNHGQWPRAV